MDYKDFYKKLENKELKIAVVGLGYVGLPLLIELDKYFDVIGFDISSRRIKELKNSCDKDSNVETEDLKGLKCLLTSDKSDLKKAGFFIIAVPTPIDNHNIPDLGLVESATALTAQNMPENSIIVYESTVYPGVTEDICIPVIERESGFKNGKDFVVGYSPERINPGDKVNTLTRIVKVVSSQDDESLEIVAGVYGKIIKAGVHKASSIKVAEAAKVIENTQRDINVALVNELAVIFSRIGIDTSEVLEAAKTKWNFLDFKPGLVGGHCIGVDPYYLVYKAIELGYHPEVINAGRKINDSMSEFISRQILKNIISNSELKNNIRVILFGLTFKENVSDCRNTKVADIYNYLKNYNIDVSIYDPLALKDEAKEHYGIELIEPDEIKDMDAAVFCVAHDKFKEMDLKDLKTKMRTENPMLFDIKWIFNKEKAKKAGFRYWRL